MPNILILSGSPVRDGSTEILLSRVAEGITHAFIQPVTTEIVRLNDYQYLPCQACGESPEPEYCIFKDEIEPVYDLYVNCDIVLFGTPIYFDSVSAQSKLFIDRCNCLKPADFSDSPEHHFKKVLTKKRLGAMVLVSGERQDIECARKIIAGFFKWTEVINCGNIIYSSTGMEIGQVDGDTDKLHEAFELGQKIGSQAIIDGI
jgi:multimeric flavodoxin WrbA